MELKFIVFKVSMIRNQKEEIKELAIRSENLE